MYQFSRQVFAPDWSPDKEFKITSPQDIAAFVSSHRLGQHGKMSLLVLDNNANVTANLFLPWTKLEDIKDFDSAGELLAGYVHQCGGTRAVLYGNYSFSIADVGLIRVLEKGMKRREVDLLDVLHMDQSARENGIISEPAADVTTALADEYDDALFQIASSTMPTAPSASEYYERHVRSAHEWSTWQGIKNRIYEAYVDVNTSLTSLQNAIAMQTGDAIADDEDAHRAFEHLSSIDTAEMETFRRDYVLPMQKAIAAVLKATGLKPEDMDRYLMAKHGIERNAYMRDQAIQELHDTDTWTQDKEDAIMQRDYAGLSAMFADRDDYDQAAQEYVADMEDAMGKDGTDRIWKAIRAATHFSIEKLYRSGLATNAQYDKVKDMYEYYVPLRGFTEQTIGDMYEYSRSGGGAFNAPYQHARGRRSQAVSPLAYIVSMGESAIMQGNRNIAKQHLLNLALNHENKLLQVRTLYAEQDPQDPRRYVIIMPNIPDGATAAQVHQALEDYETRMKAALAAGTVKRITSKFNAGYIAVDKRMAGEHFVVVYKGGRPYTVMVNGNPRAAQAANGTLARTDTLYNRAMEKIFRGWLMFNRTVASLFTTLSLNFIGTNTARDLIYSRINVGVEGSKAYRRAFRKAWRQSFGHIIPLMRRYRRGTLDMNDPLHRAFAEFVAHGGMTGYAQLSNIRNIRRRMERDLKKLSGKTTSVGDGIAFIFDAIKDVNEAAETMTRFAAFLASRNTGLSVAQAVSAAKDITVNFNRVGAHNTPLSAAAPMLYLFFNAGVQSFAKLSRMVKAHPVKMAGVAASLFSLGYAMPLVNGAIAMLLAGGDDDDDPVAEMMRKYYALSDYVRRNNLCIYTGHGFVTIPLPIEYRGFYGMGSIVRQWGDGEFMGRSAVMEMASGLMDALPLNPVEDNNPLVPDALKTIVEAHDNRDFTGRPLYKDTPWNKNEPQYTKAYRGTNPYLVRLSEFVNRMTGGNEHLRGWGDVPQLNNPAVVEHILQGYGGGPAQLVSQLGHTFRMAFGREDWDPRNMPVVTRFYRTDPNLRYYSARVRSKYYRMKDEFDETARLMRAYRKEAEDGSERYAGLADELALSPRWQRYTEYNDNHRKDIEKALKDLKEMQPGDERDLMEDAITVRMQQMFDRLDELEEEE